jgi:hypothetical protein
LGVDSGIARAFARTVALGIGDTPM